MKLMPQPQEIDYQRGEFVLNPKTEIVLIASEKDLDLEIIKDLQDEIKKRFGFEILLNKKIKINQNNKIYLKFDQAEAESYQLKIDPQKVIISGADRAGLFYGIQTLIQLIKLEGRQLPAVEINDYPDFKNRGFYHDVARGKIPTLSTLKEIIDKAAHYKLNQIQLYIEHTFLFEGLSEVWTGADPLTAEDIIELDQYSKKRGVELVPSLSSFGHLYTALSTNSFKDLAELEVDPEAQFSWIKRMRHHTLNVSNPESIEFVKKMLQQFIPLFSSDKFNICGDETFDLGQGKNKALAAEIGQGQMYLNFLLKLINEVKKYDKKVMMWGDIIVKYPDLIDQVPEDVIILNWDYGYQPPESKAELIAKNGYQQYLCPGVASWNRLVNNFDMSFTNIRKMADYAEKYDASGILNTNWGDFGNINFWSTSVPGMIYGADLSWNSAEKGTKEEVYQQISRLEYADQSGKIVSLLNELSEQHSVTWDLVIAWKEKIYEQSTLFDEDHLKNSFLDLEGAELQSNYQASLEIADRLLDQGPLLAPDKRQDLDEFHHAAEGVALLNSLGLMLKKFHHDEEDIILVHSPEELAGLLENWLWKYSKLWRQRNKESELYRIREAVMEIANYLRKI